LSDETGAGRRSRRSRQREPLERRDRGRPGVATKQSRKAPKAIADSPVRVGGSQSARPQRAGSERLASRAPDAFSKRSPRVRADARSDTAIPCEPGEIGPAHRTLAPRPERASELSLTFVSLGTVRPRAFHRPSTPYERVPIGSASAGAHRDRDVREPRFTPWREGRHQRARSCRASGRGFGVPPPLAARHLKSLAGTPGSSLSGTATVAAPRRPPDARGAQPHGPPPRSNGDRAPPRHPTRTDRNRFRHCARTTISLQDGVRRSVRNSEILFVDALPCVGQANARAHQWPARPARHAAPRHGQYPAGAGSGPRRGWRRRCRAPGGRGMEQISAGSKLSGANSRN
jgi:hypothetical protein